MFIAHSGTAGSLDFFFAAPASLVHFLKGNPDALRLRPVVRVQLTTFELFAFMERVRAIVADVKQSLPAAHIRETVEPRMAAEK